jgi:predicted 3-demethylubiquinone-9 3-methyltransferase (glyoxalase superfamily)
MQKIAPCLWFDDNAEEAVNFYLSVFPDSRIVNSSRYGDSGPGPKGSIMVIRLELSGQQFMALNGGPLFKFTEAISLVVNVVSQDELDAIWSKLLQGGQPVQCGWLKDRFGLSWQIVPTLLGEMMQDKDSARSNRVMQAMLKMVKLDIAELKRAYDGP